MRRPASGYTWRWSPSRTGSRVGVPRHRLRSLTKRGWAWPRPPPRRPDRSRIHELVGVKVPVLVVQGQQDPFGRPEPTTGREIVLLPGDHSLKADPGAVGRAVAQWLQRRLADGGTQS